MFESDIYFEPYHHVFKVLRNLNEEQFPMRNFVIDIDVNIKFIIPTMHLIEFLEWQNYQ